MKQLTKEQNNHIEKLMKELTLEEKIGMIHGNGLFRTEGVERLGIPPLKMSDGPMGVRNDFENANWKTIGLSDDFVSYLPSNSAIAATWNRSMAYELGKVLGEEARGRGKDVILAPGINIKRSPLCGRNFEYMSEDPYLIEELAVPIIQGVQEYDVAACVKHFAANNQETKRLEVEAIVDERALRELYLPGFKASIDKGESYSIMGAYNKLRGEHCCHSQFLLNGILREEWNYDGTVISDWGGVHDTVEAANSALDIEMSVTYNFEEYFMANPLLEAVRKGEISEGLIDEKVKNILVLMTRLNIFADERIAGTYNTPEHRQVIHNAARESVILLKNEDSRLPLSKKVKKLAVIGQNAEMIHSNGGGSAEIKSLYEVSPLHGIKKLLGGNAEVSYAKGYYIVPKCDDTDTNWQESSLEDRINGNHEKEDLKKEVMQKRQEYLAEAVELARNADEVIIIGGLNHDIDTEGADKPDYKLPYGQDELIKAVLEVNSNAVVVMVAGSPVEMNVWADKAKAIVWSWYAGMEGGTALAEVLFGDVNPSGKLPETFPLVLTDSPAHCIGEFPGNDTVDYKEGIYVGYRYFDTKKVATRYCFGHGLSYTTFAYSDLELEVIETSDITVRGNVTVKNTGNRTGAEVVQIYVSDPICNIDRPSKELKAFIKVELEAGEERTVSFTLDKSSFAYYNVNSKSFLSEAGEYDILVGSSCEDMRVNGKIQLEKDYSFN